MVSQPWGGHGRVVWQTRARTRGAHVWAARTLPADNFAKLRRAMKVARTSPSGEWEIRGDRGRGRRGIVVSLFSNRISMSEWVSIDRTYVRRCVALARRDHSERKQQSPPHSVEGVAAPRAISHCSVRTRIGVWIATSGSDPSTHHPILWIRESFTESKCTSEND